MRIATKGSGSMKGEEYMLRNKLLVAGALAGLGVASIGASHYAFAQSVPSTSPTTQNSAAAAEVNSTTDTDSVQAGPGNTSDTTGADTESASTKADTDQVNSQQGDQYGAQDSTGASDTATNK